MFKEQIYKDLIEKIPDKSRIVMFGACEVALKMIEDIKKYRPKVQIIGFIDNYQHINEKYQNLPVWTLKEFLESDLKYDYIVMSTRKTCNWLFSIFEALELPVIRQTDFMCRYYRDSFDKLKKLNDDNYYKGISIFKNQEDRDLYDFLFKARCAIFHNKELRERYDRIYNLPYGTNVTIKHQYMDKINKDAVTTIIDAGLNHGLNLIAFNKLLPNLKKIYGFEILYEKVKIPFVDAIIQNGKLDIVPYCLGEKEGNIVFWYNKEAPGASFCMDITAKDAPGDIHMQKFEKLNAPVTTIDKFCRENNIKYDFIKMDIEGAEMSALKGGLETIKKYRPQLAISIYHSTSDFTDIPLFLNSVLENYTFKLGHYSYNLTETVLYAIPKELDD